MTTDAVATPDADADDLLTAGAAARMAGVVPATLRRAVSEGRLTATRTPGGHNRYRRGDVLAAMNRPGKFRRDHGG